VTAMMLPLRTAREIPTFGSKGDPVEMCWRWLLKVFAPAILKYNRGLNG